MTTQQFACPPPERDIYGLPHHGYFVVTITNLRGNSPDIVTTEQVQRWDQGRLVEVISTQLTYNGITVDASTRATCH